MPDKVGKLCEEGFQITAWKGIYVYISIRQSYLQHHYMCVKYLQLIRTLLV